MMVAALQQGKMEHAKLLNDYWNDSMKEEVIALFRNIEACEDNIVYVLQNGGDSDALQALNRERVSLVSALSKHALWMAKALANDWACERSVKKAAQQEVTEKVFSAASQSY